MLVTGDQYARHADQGGVLNAGCLRAEALSGSVDPDVPAYVSRLQSPVSCKAVHAKHMQATAKELRY